jgi:putative sporulation protein YyaC
MIKFVFNSLERNNSFEISKCLRQNYNSKIPIIVCVGSDLVVGDSLGPYVGTKLIKQLGGKAFVYGTLDSPITAKEIPIISQTIKTLHPLSKIIVIDAAVGNKEDVGQVKIYDQGIKPGLGVNKNLPLVGDVSIIGIVSNNINDKNALHSVRLWLVEKLASDIINGVRGAFGGV